MSTENEHKHAAVLSMSPDIEVETKLKLRLEIPEGPGGYYNFQDAEVSMAQLSYVLRAALWVVDADNKDQDLKDAANTLREALEHAGMCPAQG